MERPETMIRLRIEQLLAFALLPSLVTLAATGCAPLNLHHMRLPWQEKQDEFKSPERIVTFWSDTVLHQSDKPAIRGFGGRVFFYGEDESTPIEVDGSLAVYAFDADRYDPSNQRPEKKYVFTAEQLKEHFSNSEMGPSYSVWLPWDEVLGPTRNVSLVTRFEGREGGIVISEPANKLLPGTGTADSVRVEQTRREGSDAVRLVAHEQEVAGAAAAVAPESLTEGGGHLQSESIDLPPSFLRRLQQDNASDAANTNAALRKSAPESASTTRDSASSTLPSAPAAGEERTTSPPPRADQDSPATHSESLRFPARRTTEARQSQGPLRRGPLPGGWPSALPSTPRYGWGRTSAANAPTYRGPGALEDPPPPAQTPRN
jgi:hypothetical protein